MSAGHMSYNYAQEGNDTKELFEDIFNNTESSSVIVTDMQDGEKDMAICIFLELQERQKGYLYNSENNNFVDGVNEDLTFQDFSLIDVYITQPGVDNLYMEKFNEISKWKIFNIRDRYLIYIKQGAV